MFLLLTYTFNTFYVIFRQIKDQLILFDLSSVKAISLFFKGVEEYFGNL